MRKSLIRRSAALVFSLAAAVSVVGCSSSGAWPAQVRENFLGTCDVEGGLGTEGCNRCFDELEKVYTLDEFLEFEEAVSDGTVTDAQMEKFTGVAESCADLD